MRDILKNEVYVGDVIFRKKPSRDVITKEIDKDWEPRLVRDHHQGIIDRETWDTAQALLKYWAERMGAKKPKKAPQKPRGQKKALVAKRVEQAYSLISDGVSTIGQMAKKMDVPKSTLQYYLKQLEDAGRVKNEESVWSIVPTDNGEKTENAK